MLPLIKTSNKWRPLLVLSKYVQLYSIHFPRQFMKIDLVISQKSLKLKNYLYCQYYMVV